MYRQELNTVVCTLVVVYDNTAGLENLIQLSVRISQRLTACKHRLPAASPPPSVSMAPVKPSEPEPM